MVIFEIIIYVYVRVVVEFGSCVVCQLSFSVHSILSTTLSSHPDKPYVHAYARHSVIAQLKQCH